MNTEPLNFPIKFYTQKYIILFLLVMFALCFVGILIDTFFDYFYVSSHLELPDFIKAVLMLIVVSALLFFIKILYDNLPNIVLNKDSIALLNSLKSEYELFEFSQINKIEFSFNDEYPMLSIYLKNQPPLSNADKIYPLTYYHINGKKLHSRQVADIINQVFDNHQNHNNNPIFLRKAEKGFLDWD